MKNGSQTVPFAGASQFKHLLDASSIEIFVNEGEEVFTARYFPYPGNNDVWISARKEIIMNVTSWTMA
ncbi:GH32 C-terminal domain-containing protein [Bacillus licheniformis]|nr:GH32 C-terminal domain-containing protein [Bacillus licheniformis]